MVGEVMSGVVPAFAATSLECDMLKLLEGNVAVVTGASSGIGRAIALTFAGEGARVVLADLIDAPLEGGETTLDLILRSGGEAFFEHGHVTATINKSMREWSRRHLSFSNDWTTRFRSRSPTPQPAARSPELKIGE